MLANYQAQVQTTDQLGYRIIGLATGKATIIAGPNGTGKSSLLDELQRQFPVSQAELFSGHRQISFASDDIDQLGGTTVETLFQNIRNSPQNASRYRNSWSDQHLKSVVKRIINLHNQGNETILQAIDSGKTIAEARDLHPRLLETLNQIFKHGGLPIEIELFEGTLRAVRGPDRFSITKLSDGERAALLLVGAVLIRPANGIILVDEPERHLNPSISGPLIAAAVRARSDVAFVFATHDLPLIEWLKPDEIIYVRDSKIIQPEPEIRKYDLERLSAADGLDDKLRYALLGSRKALLLVEGELSSDDVALYKLLFDGWHVVPRGGWESVTTGVRAIRTTSSYNWLSAAGIIDGDGRDTSEKQALAADQIYALPVRSIENLFAIPDAVRAVATAIHTAKGGISVEDRMASAELAIVSTVNTEREKIIALETLWKINRAISASKPSLKSVRNGQTEVASIDITALRIEVETSFDKLMQTGTPWQILQSVPIKKSAYWGNLCDAVGVDNVKEYKSTLLWQIQSQSETGKGALLAIKQLAPSLPAIS